MIKIYYENECLLVKTLCVLRPIYGRRDGPSKSTSNINLVAKIEASDSVNNKLTPEHWRNSRSVQYIAVVCSVQEDKRQSNPWTWAFQTSSWQILCWDLGRHPYKIQLTQNLKFNDHRQSRVFTDWVLFWVFGGDPWFRLKNIFGNEAHFWMNLNKQYCYIYDNANPHEIHQVELHPTEKLVFGMDFGPAELFGLSFFENDIGENITDNSKPYRKMITKLFWPKLDGIGMVKFNVD